MNSVLKQNIHLIKRSRLYCLSYQSGNEKGKKKKKKKKRKEGIEIPRNVMLRKASHNKKREKMFLRDSRVKGFQKSIKRTASDLNNAKQGSANRRYTWVRRLVSFYALCNYSCDSWCFI